MAILVISVDLKCCRCKEKLSKILARLKGKYCYCIENIEYEEKDDRVIVRGQFCPEKLRKEIWCKAGKFVGDVAIVEAWPPKKKPSVDPPPPPPVATTATAAVAAPPPPVTAAANPDATKKKTAPAAPPKPECKLVPYPYPLPYYPLMPWGCPLHCHGCPKETPPPPPATTTREAEKPCACGCGGCSGHARHCVCCGGGGAAGPPPWGGYKVTICEADENACSVM